MNDDLKTIERRSITEHLETLNAREILTFERPYEHRRTIDWDGKRWKLPANIFSRAKIRLRVAAYNAKQSGRNEILERILTKVILHLDKNSEKWLRRVAKGDTFLGKVIFGFLDVSAIPNFHEILKAVNKQYPDATPAEKAKLVVQKVDWTRTAAGVAFAIAIALGWISPETLEGLF